MNKMKKILIKFLMLCMGLAGVLLVSQTTYASNNKDFVIEDGVLTKYNGRSEKVVIPG